MPLFNKGWGLKPTVPAHMCTNPHPRYRGYIERVSPIEPRFEVYFIDFGNKEKLNSEDVRPLDAALSAVPAQARPAQLAYVKVGGAGSSALGAWGSWLDKAVSCHQCMKDCLIFMA
jgi:hypothetical protein